jgi:hypothetical protein
LREMLQREGDLIAAPHQLVHLLSEGVGVHDGSFLYPTGVRHHHGEFDRLFACPSRDRR